MGFSPDPMVAAVVRLDDKRTELQNELDAAEGVSSALRTELAATRTQLAADQAALATAKDQLDKCKATRQWLNDRVTQLEGFITSNGLTIPAAPTPKP
jgi:chromosome segregation ATPase